MWCLGISTDLQLELETHPEDRRLEAFGEKVSHSSNGRLFHQRQFLPLCPNLTHVYKTIKAKELHIFNLHPLEPKGKDIITNEDITPLAKDMSPQLEK